MKLDLNFKILDLKNMPLKEGNDEITLGSVICSVMINTMPADQNATSAEKMRMFRIAQASSNGGDGEFKSEDIVLIKDRVAKMYGPLVVGRVYDFIDEQEQGAAKRRH